MATIRDVARKLGVSTSTVSRALTGSSGVSEKTRELVKQMAEEMNYSANRFAQNLVTARSNTIGFMIPDISDSFFAKSAYGVEEAIRNTPYTLAYTNVKRNQENVCDFLRKAEEYCYAGAFITVDEWSEQVKARLYSMRIPIISLRRRPPGDMAEFLPYVVSDDFGGMESIINHLLNLGHQKFGYIGFDTLVGAERLNAFEKTARKHGIDFYSISSFSYHDAGTRILGGYNSAQSLLNAHNDITALCAGDDQLAIGALQYLDEVGIRVPQDISLVGHDDRDVTQLYCIQLTTVHQHLFEIGEYAGRMMLDMIAKPDQMRPNGISVPMELRVRRTTGPAPQR